MDITGEAFSFGISQRSAGLKRIHKESRLPMTGTVRANEPLSRSKKAKKRETGYLETGEESQLSRTVFEECGGKSHCERGRRCRWLACYYPPVVRFIIQACRKVGHLTIVAE